MMATMSTGHVHVAKIAEASFGCSIWKDKAWLLFIVWVHICVNACWSVADDINSIFPLKVETLSNISSESLRRTIHG